MLKPVDFFDLNGNPYSDLFNEMKLVWDALKELKNYIRSTIRSNTAPLLRNGPVISRTIVLYQNEVLESGFEITAGIAGGKGFSVIRKGSVLKGASLLYAGAVLMDNNIQIGEGCLVEPGALIKGPSIIGDGSEIRQGAYIRGDVLVGRSCIIGHATEVKHSVMLGGSKAGHFAYIGDSILGSVNLGAGTKLSNLKIVDSEVVLNIKGRIYHTGLNKFGAVMGDGSGTGCNSVTAPGTILGKNVLIYPNAYVNGFREDNTIIKLKQNQMIQKKRD